MTQRFSYEMAARRFLACSISGKPGSAVLPEVEELAIMFFRFLF